MRNPAIRSELGDTKVSRSLCETMRAIIPKSAESTTRGNSTIAAADILPDFIQAVIIMPLLCASSRNPFRVVNSDSLMNGKPYVYLPDLRREALLQWAYPARTAFNPEDLGKGS